MARRITAAARAAGDTSLPGTGSLAHNIYRWERGKHHLTDRYRLYYCRALGITPATSAPAARPPSPRSPACSPPRSPGGWKAPPDRTRQPRPARWAPPPELNALRLIWGDAYDITGTAARFRARRRDATGSALAAETPAQLDLAIMKHLRGGNCFVDSEC